MKLLLFSDLHCDVDAARQLLALAGGVDVLVGAGDFGNIRRGVHLCLDVLKACGKPAVLVPGNSESAEELAAAARSWPAAQVLHGSGAKVAGCEFFGLGGGVPVTPFGDWSYDFTEQEAAGLLADCPAGCVLVTHSPPKGAVDVSSSGHSLGSTAVRDCILRKQPRLVVCGHIHASSGQHELIGKIPVVNAGPDGVLWELP